jgi:hypothetical protein
VRRYEQPPLVTHSVADDVLGTTLAGAEPTMEPNAVLIGLALADEDRSFVERWCLRVARESADPALIATAALCLGHLARRFGVLERESVELVRHLAARSDLDSRVLSANEDVDFFLAARE